MEIERKFLINSLPEHLDTYPFHKIEQGYLSTDPVLRVRRQDDAYILTYKGSGMMCREEYNLPLTREAYEHLKPKTDGIFIEKTRYLIPWGAYTIELDLFSGDTEGLILAEVEFPSEEEANRFTPPDWFDEDVTFSPYYHNSYISRYGVHPRR